MKLISISILSTLSLMSITLCHAAHQHERRVLAKRRFFRGRSTSKSSKSSSIQSSIPSSPIHTLLYNSKASHYSTKSSKAARSNRYNKLHTSILSFLLFIQKKNITDHGRNHSLCRSDHKNFSRRDVSPWMPAFVTEPRTFSCITHQGLKT